MMNYPLDLFIAAFFLSASAGLAALLRTNSELTKLKVISAILNSGLVGLTICLLWYTYYKEKENLFFLLGLCVLAGLGGGTTVDLVLDSFRKFLERGRHDSP